VRSDCDVRTRKQHSTHLTSSRHSSSADGSPGSGHIGQQSGASDSEHDGSCLLETCARLLSIASNRIARLACPGELHDIRRGRCGSRRSGQTVGARLTAGAGGAPTRGRSVTTTPRTRAPRSAAGLNSIPATRSTTPHLLQPDQPGRAIVRVSDRRPAAPLRSPLSPSTRETHPLVGSGVKPEPQAVHLDQIRRGILAKLGRLLQLINGAGH
jgi:hypothetical protein